MGKPNTPSIESLVCRATRARRATRADRIQSLWSGYGEIVRYDVEGADMNGARNDSALSSVIIKSVTPPTAARHPRGWTTDRSHERKLKSYAVERHWYEEFARRCGAGCRVPRAFACHGEPGSWLFVLEDLDAAGYADRRETVSEDEVSTCLRWLACFHATFLGAAPGKLWTTGTYWHLATRPDELRALDDEVLRKAAPRLDEALSRTQFKTLVHGDAKVENFCFAASDRVAAVDFQYVGGGTGMKDVAYFFSSIWSSRECEALASDALDLYFTHLRERLMERAPHLDPGAVEADWRALYPVAWADFYRFLLGWAPGHYKIHPYSQRMTKMALAAL